MDFVIIIVHNNTYTVPYDMAKLYFPEIKSVMYLDIPYDYIESFDIIHQLFYNNELGIHPDKICKVIQIADFLKLNLIVEKLFIKICRKELLVTNIEDLREIQIFSDVIVLFRIMEFTVTEFKYLSPKRKGNNY